MVKKTADADLTNELVYHRYLMNNGQFRQHFKALNVSEYLTLRIVAEAVSEEEGVPGRTYLEELARRMQLSIPQGSRIVRALRDKGLVRWAHDGNGKDGTYVELTGSGLRLLHEQEERLKDYYSRVIAAYGREDMIRLLDMMERLESVMTSELKETEAAPDGDGPAD